MATGTEIERLYSTVDVELSGLKTGMAEARNVTSAATDGMAADFDKASKKIAASSDQITKIAKDAGAGIGKTASATNLLTDAASSAVPALVSMAAGGEGVIASVAGAATELGGMAGVLTGPWGIAMAAGVAISAVLVANILETGDAAVKTGQEMANSSESAKSLNDALDGLDKAMGRFNISAGQARLNAIGHAEAMLVQEIQARKTTKAMLELAIAQAQKDSAGAVGGRSANYGGQYVAQGSQRDVTMLRAQLGTQDDAIADAQRRIAAGYKKDAQLRADGNAKADEKRRKAEDAAQRRLDADSRRGESAARRAANEAERAEKERYQKARAYSSAEDNAQRAVTSAQAALAIEVEDRAAAMRAASEEVRINAADQIAANRDFTSAQKETLTGLNDQAAALRLQKINRDAGEQAANEGVRLHADQLNAAKSVLEQQASLARTASERRDIELQILQADLMIAREKEEQVLLSQTATKAEKAAASIRLEAINATEGGKRENIRNRTQGPIEGFLDSIPRTAAEANEALETIAARGLADLNDGLADALMGTKSLGEVFHGVANQIVADLARMVIKQAVLGPILGLFGGGGGAGTSRVGSGAAGIAPGETAGVPDNLWSTIFGGIGGLFGKGGARAVGGPAQANRAYDVGTGEKFIPSSNGRILSRSDAMAAMGGGGGGPGKLVVEVSGARGNAEIEQMVQAGVKSGLAQYDRAVGDRVNKNYQRRAG